VKEPWGQTTTRGPLKRAVRPREKLKSYLPAKASSENLKRIEPAKHKSDLKRGTGSGDGKNSGVLILEVQKGGEQTCTKSYDYNGEGEGMHELGKKSGEKRDSEASN